MWRRQKLNAVVIVAAAALCMQAAAADSLAAETPLDALAQRTMQQYGIPGMSIGIIDGSARRICHYGVASLETEEPVTGNTLFEIGSLSKLFAAALSGVAQQRGELDLSAPVATYLPWLDGTAMGTVSALGLATHTASGLPLFVPDSVVSESQVQGYFADFQPVYPSGARRTYSNPGIGLLGKAAAASLDVPYAEAVRTHIFNPLSMTRSFFAVPTSQLEHYAQGYTVDGEPVRLSSGALADEAYGVRSTAADLLRFLDASLEHEPGRAQLPSALTAMQTGFYQVGPMTQALVWERYPLPVSLETLAEGNSSDMALGTHEVTALSAPDATRRAWVNKTGSTNGFAGYLAMLPAQSRAVVILANRNYPATARVELARAILGQSDAHSSPAGGRSDNGLYAPSGNCTTQGAR